MSILFTNQESFLIINVNNPGWPLGLFWMRGSQDLKNMDLYEKLTSYCDSDAIPFHMPGHKRRTDHELLGQFPNPFRIDITEIDGFDDLHHAEGILREAMDKAASIYGAERSYYLVNGSTGGILSAVSWAADRARRPVILMARNCHKAAYHGVFLNRLSVGYLYPQIIEDFGLQGGLLPEDVESMLITCPHAAAVFIVSPTYDGVVSDVRAIAEICRRYQVPLIVDEAHGAHFPFWDRPVSALEQGADLVIQSLHKTLPSLTQTAILHVRKGFTDFQRLEYFLQIYQSSSPSYVFMAAMERCVSYMDGPGRKELAEFEKRLEYLRRQLGRMKCLRLLDVKHGSGIYDLDPSKIVVSCAGTGLSGEELMERLRSAYGLELEMCGVDYVTAITTFMDTEERLKRLSESFLDIDRTLSLSPEMREKRENGKAASADRPEGVYTMAEARSFPGKQVHIEESAGWVSKEFVYAYPPGIPILTPGERIHESAVKQIAQYRRTGLKICGMEDPKAEILWVIRENE